MLSHQNQTIKSLSEDDRPREKMLVKGTQALSNAELLAILIGSGNKEMNAVQLAQFILKDTDNNLNALAKKSIAELKKYKGIGSAKAVTVAAALELGRRRKLTQESIQIVSDSEVAYQILSPHLADLVQEEFWVLFLGNNNRLVGKKRISSGGMTGTVADVRLIFKEALLHHATKIILAHNHPSGNLEPSRADHVLTEKMIAAGKTMDIRVVDHLIITQSNYRSMMQG